MKRFQRIISGITALTLCFATSVNLTCAAGTSKASATQEYQINIDDEGGLFGGYDVYLISDYAYFEGYTGGMSYFNLAEGASEEEVKKILGKYFDLNDLSISSDDSKTYCIGNNGIMADNRNEQTIAQDACRELKEAGLISSFNYAPSERRYKEVKNTFDNYAPEDKEKLVELSQEKGFAFEVTEVQQSPSEAPKTYTSYCHVTKDTETTSLYENIKLAQKIYEVAGIRPLMSFSLTDTGQRYKDQIDLFTNCAPKIPEILFGDVNGDKIIDINDMTKLSLYLLGDVHIDTDKIAPADTNGDGCIDLADLATLKQYLMKDKITLGYKKFQYNNDITLIRVYSNFSWSPEYNVAFWDKHGNEYNFDLTKKDYKLSDGEIMKKAELVYKSSVSGDSTPFTEDEMNDLDALIYNIDTEAKYEISGNVNDAGDSILYGVKYNEDGSSELVQIIRGGQIKCFPTDENAYKAFKLFTSKVTNNNFFFNEIL